jgi:polar amino acid transport system substrate-binding protein
MKNKKLFLVILALFIIAIIAGFLWYKNFRAADDSLANIKNKGVLVIGSDIPYGVMEFFDEDNNPAGVDVDIAQEIASRLGVRLEFNDYDWDQLFDKVKSGEIDLALSSITITPARQKEMRFSDPYFNGGQVIVVSSANQEISGVKSLVGKKIAVQKDTTGYTEAKKYTPEDLISVYLNFENTNGAGIISDLKNEKFEAIIVDYIQALSMIKDNSGLKIIGVPFTKEDYGIATRLSNNTLMEKINSILEGMKSDGTLDKIKTTWTKI